MKPALLFLLLSSIAPAAAALDVEVSSGLAFAGRPGNARVGVLGQLGVAFHSGGAFVPEVIGQSGAWQGLEHASLGLELGVRWQPLPRESVSPWLWLALAHGHDMTMHVLTTDPVGSVGGTGEGIRHRTGLAAGLGLTAPVPLPWRLRLLARVGATSLWPQVDASRVTLSGTVAIARAW